MDEEAVRSGAVEASMVGWKRGASSNSSKKREREKREVEREREIVADLDLLVGPPRRPSFSTSSSVFLFLFFFLSREPPPIMFTHRENEIKQKGCFSLKRRQEGKALKGGKKRGKESFFWKSGIVLDAKKGEKNEIKVMIKGKGSVVVVDVVLVCV
jgi:hypothetical protein